MSSVVAPASPDRHDGRRMAATPPPVMADGDHNDDPSSAVAIDVDAQFDAMISKCQTMVKTAERRHKFEMNGGAATAHLFQGRHRADGADTAAAATAADASRRPADGRDGDDDEFEDVDSYSGAQQRVVYQGGRPHGLPLSPDHQAPFDRPSGSAAVGMHPQRYHSGPVGQFTAGASNPDANANATSGGLGRPQSLTRSMSPDGFALGSGGAIGGGVVPTTPELHQMRDFAEEQRRRTEALRARVAKASTTGAEFPLRTTDCFEDVDVKDVDADTARTALGIHQMTMAMAERRGLSQAPVPSNTHAAATASGALQSAAQQNGPGGLDDDGAKSRQGSVGAGLQSSRPAPAPWETKQPELDAAVADDEGNALYLALLTAADPDAVADAFTSAARHGRPAVAKPQSALEHPPFAQAPDTAAPVPSSNPAMATHDVQDVKQQGTHPAPAVGEGQSHQPAEKSLAEGGVENQQGGEGHGDPQGAHGAITVGGRPLYEGGVKAPPVTPGAPLAAARDLFNSAGADDADVADQQHPDHRTPSDENINARAAGDDRNRESHDPRNGDDPRRAIDVTRDDHRGARTRSASANRQAPLMAPLARDSDESKVDEGRDRPNSGGTSSGLVSSTKVSRRHAPPPPPKDDTSDDSFIVHHVAAHTGLTTGDGGAHSYPGVPVFGANQHQHNQPQDELDHHHAGQGHATSGHPLSHGQREALGPASSTWTPAPSAGVSVSRPPPPAPELSDHHHQDHHDGSQPHFSQQCDVHPHSHHPGAQQQQAHLQPYHQSPQGQEVSPGGPPAVPLQETHVPSAADGGGAQQGEQDHLGMMNSDGGDMMTLPPPNVVDGFQPEQRLPTRGYVESVQQQRPPPAHLVGAASSSQQGGQQHAYHNGPNQHEQEGQGQETTTAMAAAPGQHQHHPQEVTDDTALPLVPTPDASAIERGGHPDSYINAFREPGEVTPSRFGFGDPDGGAQGDDGRSAATRSGADGALASSPTAAETAASVQRSGLTDDHLFDLPTEKDDSASLYPKPPAAQPSDNAAEAGGFSNAGGGAANGAEASMPTEGGGAPSGLPPLAPGQLAAGPSSSSRPSPRVPVRPVAAPNGLVPTPMAGYDDFESEAGSPDGHHHPGDLRDSEGGHGVGENEARARARRTPPPPPPPPAPALPPKLPTKRSPTSTNPLAPGDTPPPASPFADTAPLPSATLHHGSSSGDGGAHGSDRQSSSHDGQRHRGGDSGRDSGRKSRRNHRNNDRLSNSNSRSNESNEDGVTSGDGTGTRTREPAPVLGMPRPRRHGPPDDDDEDDDTRLPPSSSKTKPARHSDSKQNPNRHSADGQRSPTSRHRRHRSEGSPRNGNDQQHDDRMDRKYTGGNHPRPGVGGHRGNNDDDDEEDDRSSSGSYSYSYTYTDGGSSDQWSDGNISDFLEEDFGPGPGPGGRKAQQKPDGVRDSNRPSEVRGGPKQSQRGGQPQGRRDGDRRTGSGQAPPPVRPDTRRAVAGSSGGGQTQAPVRMAAAARTVMAARRLERNMGGNPNAVRPHQNPNPNQNQNSRNPSQQGVPPGMASSSALVPHGSSIAGPLRGEPTKPSRGGMSGASSYQLQPRPSSSQQAPPQSHRPQSAVRDPYAVQLRSHSAGGLPPAAAYRSASGQSFHTQQSMSMPPGKSGPPGQWSQSPVPPNPNGNQDVNGKVQQRGPRPGQHPRVVYPSATSEGRSRTPTAMAHHRSADGFLHDGSGGPGLIGGGGKGGGGAPPGRTPFTQVVPPAEFARMLGSDARKEHPDMVKVDPMRAQVAAVLAGHPEGVHSPLDTARGDTARGGQIPRAQSHNMRGRHAHAHSASPLRYGTGEKDISDGAPGIAGDGAGPMAPSHRDLSMNSAGPTRSASAVAAAVAASHRAAVARGEGHFGHTTARDGQPPALLPPPPSGSQVSTGGASLAHNSLLNPGVPPSHGGFTGAGGVGGSAAHRTASPGGPPGYYSGVLGLTHGPPQSKSFIPGSAGYAGGEPAPPLPKTRPSLNGARPGSSNAGAGLNGLTSQRQSPRPHHQPKNDAHQQAAHSSSMRGRLPNAGSSAGSRPPTPPRPAGNSRQSPTPMAIQMAFGQQPPVASPSVPPSPNQTPRGPRDASGRDGGRGHPAQHGQHGHSRAALAPPDVTPGPGRVGPLAVAGTGLAPPDMTPAPAGHQHRSSTPPPKSQVPHGPAPTVRVRPSSVGRTGGATPRAGEVQVPGDRKNTPRGC